MRAWLRQHAGALMDALGHLRRSPGSFCLNVLVVGIALALPVAGLTLLENLRPVSQQVAFEPEVSIFLNIETPREQAAALALRIQRVAQDAGTAGRLEFIPRETALGTLKARSGLSDAITALGENPLPDSYVLTLPGYRNAADATRIDALAVQLKALPGIEYVQVDSAWTKRLAALLSVLRLGLLFLATTLGVVVIAVVFNTTRLQVLTQREEIEICRMFGATDRFIYRPFYYSGALLGLLAGVLALTVVTLALQPLNLAITDFARLYASEFRLAPLSSPIVLAVMATSAALGLIGALLSVGRHLARLH
jgi:cell division transport system permease protein